MIIWNTGFPRSGTTSFALFYRMFVEQVQHEPYRFYHDIADWLDEPVKQRDIDKPDKQMVDYVCGFGYLANNKPFIASGWGVMFAIHAIDEQYNADGHIKWLITLRNAWACCNSLYNYRTSKYTTHLFRSKPTITFDDVVRKYIEYWDWAVTQIERMKVRPKWMDFDGLIHDKYNDKLMDMVHIENNEVIKNVCHNHWQTKIYTFGDYELHHSPLLEEAELYIPRIKAMCEEL